MVGFDAKLKDSQLNDIMKYLKNKPKDVNAAFLSCSSFLSGIVDSRLAESEKKTKCKFLCDQMKLNTYKKYFCTVNN